MKTNAERHPEMVTNFRAAIYDALKAAHPDGNVVLTTDVWETAAIAGFKDIIASEIDPVDALLAVNVWKSVMLSNISAFRQTLEREIEAKTIEGIRLVNAKRAVAKKYME